MDTFSRKDVDWYMSNIDVNCWNYSYNVDKCLKIVMSPEANRHEVNVMARRLIETLTHNKQTRFLPRGVLLEVAAHIISDGNPNLDKLTQRNKSRLTVIIATS